MTPLIVSSKVSYILAIAFSVCMNHTHDGKTFDPGFGQCPQIMSAAVRSETVEEEQAAAKKKAEDEAVVAKAVAALAAQESK